MGSAGTEAGVGGGHSETTEKKTGSAKVGGSGGIDIKNKVILNIFYKILII